MESFGPVLWIGYWTFTEIVRGMLTDLLSALFTYVFRDFLQIFHISCRMVLLHIFKVWLEVTIQ